MKRRESERGAALIIVIFASTLVLLLLMTMLTVTLTSNRTVARQLAAHGQALSSANAGLTEGLSWFVRQREQPVTAFDPIVDAGGVCTHVPAHDPLVFDSEEPATGIVRSFEITPRGRVWGRYEVRRGDVKDVSLRRGKDLAGTIWQLESEGIVYVRNDAAKAPDVAPNFVLARRTMRVDIQRLGLKPPGDANAAILARRGSWITLINPSRIEGGASADVAYPRSTGSPGGSGASTINSRQQLTGVTASNWSISKVFGVSTNELIAMADVVVDDESQLPDPLPDMALVVIRGNATFNGDVKLRGSGILVALGNLVITPQSNAYYSGVIWVGGNFTMQPPGIISGTIIANGTVQVAGGSDVAEINYDSAIIDQVKLRMGNYLFSRSPWVVTQ